MSVPEQPYEISLDFLEKKSFMQNAQFATG